MSYAAASGMPSTCASCGASAGVWWKWEMVARITASICAGASPARSIACCDASSDRLSRVSPSAIQRRSRIPVRWVIHSSEESMNWHM